MQAALFAGFGVYRRVKKKKWVFWTYRPRVFFVFDSACCSFFSIPARIRGAFSGVDPRTRIFRRIGSTDADVDDQRAGSGKDGGGVAQPAPPKPKPPKKPKKPRFVGHAEAIEVQLRKLGIMKPGLKLATVTHDKLRQSYKLRGDQVDLLDAYARRETRAHDETIARVAELEAQVHELRSRVSDSDDSNAASNAGLCEVCEESHHPFIQDLFVAHTRHRPLSVYNVCPPCRTLKRSATCARLLGCGPMWSCNLSTCSSPRHSRSDTSSPSTCPRRSTTLAVLSRVGGTCAREREQKREIRWSQVSFRQNLFANVIRQSQHRMYLTGASRPCRARGRVLALRYTPRLQQFFINLPPTAFLTFRGKGNKGLHGQPRNDMRNINFFCPVWKSVTRWIEKAAGPGMKDWGVCMTAVRNFADAAATAARNSDAAAAAAALVVGGHAGDGDGGDGGGGEMHDEMRGEGHGGVGGAASLEPARAVGATAVSDAARGGGDDDAMDADGGDHGGASGVSADGKDDGGIDGVDDVDEMRDNGHGKRDEEEDEREEPTRALGAAAVSDAARGSGDDDAMDADGGDHGGASGASADGEDDGGIDGVDDVDEMRDNGHGKRDEEDNEREEPTRALGAAAVSDAARGGGDDDAVDADAMDVYGGHQRAVDADGEDDGSVGGGGSDSDEMRDNGEEEEEAIVDEESDSDSDEDGDGDDDHADGEEGDNDVYSQTSTHSEAEASDSSNSAPLRRRRRRRCVRRRAGKPRSEDEETEADWESCG